MKTMKRWISGVLACALAILTACGSSAPAGSGSSAHSNGDGALNAATGRYIEEEYRFPDEVRIIVGDGVNKQPDGTLQMVASASEGTIKGPWSIWNSADGGNTWTKKEAPWLSQFDSSMIEGIAFSPDGTVYVCSVTYTDEFIAMLDEAMKTGVIPPQDAYPPVVLHRADPNGTVTECAIQFKENDADMGVKVQISGLLVLQNGDLLINYGDRFIQYETETFQQKNEFLSGWGDAVVIDQKLMVSTEEGLEQFDLETGETLETIPVDGSAESNLIAAGRDGKTILRCNTTGIYRFVIGGSVWEQVVDGELSSLGMPSLWLFQIVEKENGDFLVMISSEEGYGAINFSFSADMPSVPSNEMVVYSINDNESIRQTIGLFQRQHPEFRVRVKIGVEPDSAVTTSDAIRTLNTELLAGKGPDILLLDSLPIDSYIDKGVLVDLSGVRSMISEGVLLENIANTYQRDGALYAVPLRFGVPHMWGSSDFIAKVKDLTSLADWAEANHVLYPESPSLYYLDPPALIRNFYLTCSPAWRDEKGAIQEAPFAQFLTDLKRIADTQVEPVIDDGMLTIEDYKQNDDLVYQGIYWANNYIHSVMGISYSAADLASPDAARQFLGEGAFAMMVGQNQDPNQRIYIPHAVMGINKNSAYPDEAEEFIETALSKRVQTLGAYPGFSGDEQGYAINREALSIGMESPYTDEDDGMQAPVRKDGEIKVLQVLWPEETFMQNYQKQIEALNTPSTIDEVLLEMMIDETKGFFEGEKTAEDAASAVAQRTQAYLSE